MARVEKRGSQAVEFTAVGITGKRIFESDWAERFSVRPSIGESFPGIFGLYCSRVRLEGFGKSIAAGGYTKCKIIADYSSSLRALQQEEGYIEESISISSEVIKRGGGKWEDGDVAVKDNDPSSLAFYPRAEWTVNLTIADINEWAGRLLGAVGKVNSTTWKGGLPEKWLFMGSTSRNFINEDGDMLWVLSLTFVYRGAGGQTWNNVWRRMWSEDKQVAGQWDKIVFEIDGEKKYLFESVDFNRIIPTARRAIAIPLGVL